MRIVKNSIEPTIDQVQDYLYGRLSDEEKFEFERKINSDESFKREYQISKTILAGIDQHFDYELKSQLQALEQPTQRSRVQFTRQLFLISTAASLILVGIVFFLKVQTKPTELFAEYYRPYYNVISGSVRGNEEASKAYEEPFLLYEKQDFESAISKFKEQLLINQDDMALRYYLGLCNIEIEREDGTLDNLSMVAKTSSEFAEPAQWYLALSYLKFDKVAEAKKTLTEIVNSESAYSRRAQKLLEELTPFD